MEDELGDVNELLDGDPQEEGDLASYSSGHGSAVPSLGKWNISSRCDLPHSSDLVDLLVDDVSGVEAVVVDGHVEKVLRHTRPLSSACSKEASKGP